MWEKGFAPVLADWVKGRANGEPVLDAFRARVAEVRAGK